MKHTYQLFYTQGLIDISIEDKNPINLKFALELYQSLQARLWSTSPYVARQIEGIGPSHAKTLAGANLITMEQLRNCDPGRIEMVFHLYKVKSIRTCLQNKCIHVDFTSKSTFWSQGNIYEMEHRIRMQ